MLCCFYRTYEELKYIGHCSKQSTSPLSFYRTYEELKFQSILSFVLTKLLSFYRTYEELKYGSWVYSEGGVGVFIVPMRN
ncbi:hypothetical protein CTHBC1_2213 [Acetivibrio thermocellus BC1]|nr:hypothetical protein CTHBC1_2213 [Acetivibrio thermocellus BC1]